MHPIDPNRIPNGYDYYHNELPTTLEDRLFGPLVYGSEPISADSLSNERMLTFLRGLEEAANRTYPEFPGVETEISNISSLIQDDRIGAWSGYVSVRAVRDVPTNDPNITSSLVVESLVGNRSTSVRGQIRDKAANATRASIVWHDHYTHQGIAMSVTTNEHGYFHARPSLGRLWFTDDTIDSIVSRAPLNPTDTQLDESLGLAEQALSALQAHGSADAAQPRIRRPYIVEIDVTSANITPLDHHFTSGELSAYPHDKAWRELWRHNSLTR